MYSAWCPGLLDAALRLHSNVDPILFYLIRFTFQAEYDRDHGLKHKLPPKKKKGSKKKKDRKKKKTKKSKVVDVDDNGRKVEL